MNKEIACGVLFSVVMVVWVMLEHLLGFNTTRHDLGEYTRLAGVIIPILAIWVALKEKQSDSTGPLTFAQGMKSALVVAAVQTVLTTAWFWIYGNVINPGYLDSLVAYEVGKLTVLNAPAAAVAQKEQEMRAFMAAPRLQLFQLLLGIAYGLLFGALFTWWLRRKGDQPIGAQTVQ